MAKYTVTGDLGSFKTGQVLKREKEIIAYHRAVLDEGADKPSDLSDEVILACVEKIEGDNEDAELQRIELMEAGGVTPDEIIGAVNVSAQSSPIAIAAANMAAKISDHTSQDVNELIDAKEITKKGPAVIALDFSRDFTPEQIDAMPVPGSTAEKTNNPDRYSEKVVVKGEEKKRPASYYGKLHDSSKIGQPIMIALNDMALAQADDAAASAAYKRMTKTERTAETARLSQRRTTGRTNMILAVKVLKQFSTVNAMENCGVRFFFEDAKAKPEDRRIKNTPACIIVFDKHEPINGSPISVGKFLRLKPDAIKHDAKLADLLETSSKKKPAAGTGAAEQAAYSLDVMVPNTGLMYFYTEKLRHDDKLLGAYYNRLNTSDDFVLNTFRLAEWFEMVTTKPELAKRYAKINAELAVSGSTQPVKAAA